MAAAAVIKPIIKTGSPCCLLIDVKNAVRDDDDNDDDDDGGGDDDDDHNVAYSLMSRVPLQSVSKTANIALAYVLSWVV